MITKKISAGVGLLLFAAGAVQAQDQTAFKVLPEKPLPGTTIHITYDPATTPLAGQDSIRGIVYEYNNFTWEAKDLALNQQGKTYSTDLALPADCGLIACKFYKGDVTDVSNERGYFYMMVDSNGIAATGAYAGYGLLRGPRYGRGVENYYQSLNISDTAVYYWLSQELSYHKKGQFKLSDLYAISNYNYEHDTASPKIVNVLNFLLTNKNITEAHYEKAIRIYRETGRPRQADSLTAATLARYPEGNIARKIAYKDLNDKNLDTALAKNLRFLKQFPPDQFPTPSGVIPFGDVDYNKVYNTIILVSSIKGDNKPVYEYAHLCNYNELITLFYKMVEIPYYLKKTMTAKEAAPLADTLQHYIQQYKHSPDGNSGLYSPDQWTAQIYGPSQARNAVIYADILMHVDRNKEAMELTDFAKQYAASKKAELNDLHIRLLEKNNRETEVPQNIINAIKANAATPWILEKAKADYVKTHGSEEGYDAYISNLKGAQFQQEMMSRLLAEKRNDALAGFSMKDMNGRTVTLASLKGKVVVLDFWATWCAPCKASFPGMNMAREKYARDENVVFYFVDTQETKAGYQSEVKKYLKEKQFPFNVLFDNGDAEKHTMSKVYDAYAKAFQMSGIPQKLIIGPDGKLKFITVGYNGSPSELADEISAMIMLAKKAD